jgi:hypothetical protein
MRELTENEKKQSPEWQIEDCGGRQGQTKTFYIRRFTSPERRVAACTADLDKEKIDKRINCRSKRKSEIQE